MLSQQQPPILLMDQDPETLEQLQTALQREGYRVLIAVDGHAALRLARKEKPGLIISDLLLAGLDGYEVWHLLETSVDVEKTPILVLSALDVPPSGTPWQPNPSAEWRLLKYDAFLPKPIDLRRFMRVVKKLFHLDGDESIPGGPSVCIAIEDEETRKFVASILEKNEFEVETIPSLAEPAKLLSGVPPAILLLDYRNHSDVVRRISLHIKNFSPGSTIILIVNPDEQIETDLATNCDGFLTTPLYPTHIVTCINHTLELSLMQRRVEVLSNNLITLNRDLSDAQQALQAQNEELRYVNAQLRELDSLKKTFTSMVAHDLRTPLSAILGALSLLSTDPDLKLTKRANDLLTGAMTASNQMVRLTETLLEKQRLEEGHLEPDQEPFHVPTLIEICLQQVAPLMAARRLKIETSVADDLPLAYADPHISQRVLENLLDNAIKFSPRDSTIYLGVAAEADFIKVSVEDNGPGIPEEEQKTIFEQFTQLKNKEKAPNRSGFGLGLTFCYLAVQSMQGSIWVESDGKSGTAFLFTLPIYNEASMGLELQS